MTTWWFDLSVRERLLIAGGGMFLGVTILLFLIIRPLTGFQQNAVRDYDQSVRTYRQVTIAAASPQDNALDAAALRSIVTSTAAQNGIVVNRISSQDSSIDISIAGTPPARFYNWLSILQDQHQVQVRSAQIRPSSESGVTARMTLVSGGT